MYNYPNFPNYPQQMYQYTPQATYNGYTAPQNNSMNNLPPTQTQAPISPKFDVVQGALAADVYQVENGQEVILLDMDNPYVYKKKRGLDGKLEQMEKYRLVQEEMNQTPEVDMKDFVKQSEIEMIVAKLVKSEVDKKLSEITLKPSTSKKKAEE